MTMNTNKELKKLEIAHKKLIKVSGELGDVLLTLQESNRNTDIGTVANVILTLKDVTIRLEKRIKDYTI